MNPNRNMIPVRPGLNQPLYFQAYNAPPSGGFPMHQPPPSGQFILPTPGGVTGTFLPPSRAMHYQTSTSMPFQTFQGQNIQYQQSNTQFPTPGSNQIGSYVPVVPVSAAGYEQTSPLQRNSFSPNYSPLNRNQVMIVSSQTSPKPEFRPVSPMSPMLQTGIRMTSPLNGSTSSPDTGKQAPTVPNGFIAAYKDDQCFFTIGKLEDSSKAPSAEDIFKAKASNHGINISTKSSNINEATMRAFQFVGNEKFKKQLEEEKKLLEENHTQTFMNKASKYGIKIEKPFKSPNKRTHSESESSDCASIEVKTINGFLQEKWNECDEEKLNSNISRTLELNTSSTDGEKSGIEYSNILYALESKRNSKYEQMLTTLRRKSYAKEDIDDLSTLELQSPRDGSTPNDWQNFDDIPARTSESPYFSDVNSEEFNQPECKEDVDSLAEISAVSKKIVDKAISSAIQEVRIEEIIQKGIEKKKKTQAHQQSLYSWISENRSAIDEHKKTLQDSNLENWSTRSDTPHSDVRSNTPQSDSMCDNVGNSTSDTIESDGSELNPHSPEFKPSGFIFPKGGQHKKASTVLKADVPEFIPSTIPLYVPKEESSNYHEYSESLDEHDAANYNFYQYSKSPGKTQETQTYAASVVDTATNTKRTKMLDKNIETKACDVRDIVVNTVESMFDQQGDFYISDNTEEVDHGHLDVYVQTDENQNSLKLNLIDTQRQLLRTRCYSCKQQLEAEKQKIRSSKYQIFTVFTQIEDRTVVNDVVESRVAVIDTEIIRLENMLSRYEKMLDEGMIFDQVPDFGTSWDLDDINSRTVMTLETKEMQTDQSGDCYINQSAVHEENAHHRRFLTEAVKKILSKLEQHTCVPVELTEILQEVKDFCGAVCDQLTKSTHEIENLKTDVKNKLPVVCRTVESSSGGSVPLNASPVKKSISDKILSEKTKECNVPNAELTEESKENVENKDKPKTKKAKKSKKKNRNEQDKSKLPETVGNNASECSNICVQIESGDLSKIQSTQENVPELTTCEKDSAVNTKTVPSIKVPEVAPANNTESKGSIIENSGLNVNVNSSVALSKVCVNETTVRKTVCSLEDISDDDDGDDIDIEINLNKAEGNFKSDIVSNKSSQLPVRTAISVDKDNKLSKLNTYSKIGVFEKSVPIECVQLKEVKTTNLPIPTCTSKNSSEKDVKVSESSQNDSAESAKLNTDTISSDNQTKSAENQAVQGQSGLTSSYPALYKAVVQQLKQVYPQIASNPVMLNMVAAQQTAVLQMYIGKSTGSGGTNPLQAAQTAGGGLANLMQSFGAAGMPLSNQTKEEAMTNPFTNPQNTNVTLQDQNMTSVKQSLSDKSVNYPSQEMTSVDNGTSVNKPSQLMTSVDNGTSVNEPSQLMTSVDNGTSVNKPSQLMTSVDNGTSVNEPSQLMTSVDKGTSVNYPSQVMTSVDKGTSVNYPSQVMTSVDKGTAEAPSTGEKDIKNEKMKPFSVKNWLDNFPQAAESMQNVTSLEDKNLSHSKTLGCNNSISLGQKMNSYLSSNDTLVKQKVNKSLSSSIISDSTIKTSFGPPPGFGKQNEFSADNVPIDSVSSSGSSTLVPSNSSSFNETLVPSKSSSFNETLVPSKSSSFNNWAEERKEPNFDTKLTGVRTVRSPVKNSGAENTPQKPLKVPKTAFTFGKTLTKTGFLFSKTLTYNLPQSKSVSQPNDTSIKQENRSVKMTSLRRQGDSIPSLLSLPIPDKLKNISQPSTTGVPGSFQGKLSGGDNNSTNPVDSEKKWQFPSNNNGPSNLPPRIQKKRRSIENTTHPPVPSEPSWDDEVDDYAEPFILKHDVRKPVDSYAPKPVTDQLEEISLPEKRKTEKENKVEEMKDEEEDWCQVTKKKKKEIKPEVKKPATRARRPTPGDKSSKSNNFERLVGMMSEIFTGLTRPQIMEVISEVRIVRGGLSGLTVKEIVEIARSVVIRKFEHKMTNNQRPLNPSDFVNKNSVMTDRRKNELQQIISGYPSKPISTSNKFDAIETAEGRAEQMKAFNAMKALRAVTLAGQKSLDDEDDICVICHDELTFGETKMLECRHEFHTECINKWVYERERTCPTCRGHALFAEDFPKLGS